MEFDYYYNGEDEAFEEYFKFVRQVALEDYELNLVLEKYKAERAEAGEEAANDSTSRVSAVNQAPPGPSGSTTVGVGA
ncbi:unnamed protein product [Tuber aestivum]|uniref:Uncharacterized protein n=1 Tax=Tuber aestivum TaxID=59557 RepID=A0A292PVA0_9PEZI|nr:unnamed protein product [Tuber aestivum]